MANALPLVSLLLMERLLVSRLLGVTMIEILWKGTEGERYEFFLRLTDEEAQVFFNEYLAAREERLLLLTQRYVRTTGDSESDLDLSPESLETVWEWALKHIHKREFTPSERDVLMAVPEKCARDEQLRNKPVSEDSRILLNDIAYYLGEVLVRTLTGVHWKICKSRIRRYVDQNQPVLGGFTTPVNPRTTVECAASRAFDGENTIAFLLQDYERCYNDLGPEDPL